MAQLALPGLQTDELHILTLQHLHLAGQTALQTLEVDVLKTAQTAARRKQRVPYAKTRRQADAAVYLLRIRVRVHRVLLLNHLQLLLSL